jgi:hypothetical protein
MVSYPIIARRHSPEDRDLKYEETGDILNVRIVSMVIF